MFDDAPRTGTFLLTSSTASGHLLRVLDLAEQLTSRGHRVLFKTKADRASDVKAAGAELVPYEQVVDLQDFAVHAQHLSLPTWIPRLLRFPFMRGFFQARNVLLAQELEPLLRRERVDCVVYDFIDYGAAFAAERAGIPWASAGNMGTVLTRDELPLLLDASSKWRRLGKVPAVPHALLNQFVSLRADREKLGLPPYARGTAELIAAMASPHLHIIMSYRGLAGDIPLRDRQVFVGPTTFNVSAGPRGEAPRVEPGTVVVSTTTTGRDDGLFRRVLEAVAPLGVPVLGTAASAGDVPEGLGAHVRIERYIPHDKVFPEARALITHGGWGTVGRALVHGLPMLVIPLFGDQILNAALVERAGLGRHLPLDKATPETIRAELSALLADEPLRARARRASAEIQKLKQDKVAARALEELAFRDTLGGVAPAHRAA
ncbi:glycosyltransferase [Polyangium jinanense]|uniref:Glycosyltransferase family 1 protein n=1 Tax=Polyangium jinanense TaxID=2829994 RepID=A0A9X3XHA0_9BACT|nr:glycosyltransferase [Polyangium jinanense]MDC3961946.1 glycosyltransferase family 1 protein [Polyangium jinanense]MDC3988653.1 glycosyltransferase family 1 protein [Polyangium jinanense]